MSNEEISLDKLLNGHGVSDVSVKLPSLNSGKSNVDTSAKTLESYHLQNIAKLRDEKINIESLRSQLKQKKMEFDEIEQDLSAPFLSSNPNMLSNLTNRTALEKEIRDLEQKIHMVESGETEADYFLRVGDILFSYSDAQDKIATGQKVKDTTSKKSRIPANSVYSYFASEIVEDTSDTNDIQLAEHDEPLNPKKASHLVTDIGFQRDKALETYLSALNPNNVHHDAAVLSTLEENFGNCPVCDCEMFFNETFLDCPDCGHRDYILVDSEKPSYKDPPREMSYYAYKKINHLNEWLAQFQAKETTEIPPAVLDQIRTELRKERITDMGKLKPSKLKEVLKKLKLSRCYDHVAHILNRLNGISAPVLSREVEEKLRVMFKEIQFSFVKHCPKKRSNFLSYSYVLYKFCELLELDEYLPCFPLLKSREKLYMQDKIWQLICNDMRWQFIRTV
jgi:hypothetical protein